MMQQHRVLGFRRYPHATTGAVLLKVHFVRGPQVHLVISHQPLEFFLCAFCRSGSAEGDRKSTRLNSSHRCISYAVFCLKKKKKNYISVATWEVKRLNPGSWSGDSAFCLCVWDVCGGCHRCGGLALRGRVDAVVWDVAGV